MKVLNITDSYHPTVDGVALAVNTYSRLLRKIGIESEIIAPDPGDKKDRIENVHYFKSIKFKNYPGYFVPIYPSNKMEIIKNINPDIMHIHGITLMALKGLIAAHHLDIPIVMTFHTMVYDTMKYYSPIKISQKTAEKLVWKYINYFTRWVDAIVVPSKSIGDELELKGIAVKNIWIIPTPLDILKFSPRKDDYIRKKYKLTGKRIIICAGRVSFEKEIDTLIKAIKTLDDNIVLLIVGKGPATDSLKELCQRMNISNRVIFAGFQSEENLIRCYRSADIAATASRFETQCMTALEAMACGLPIVCANRRAFSDYVKDGVNGFLFDNTVESCAKALKNGLESNNSIKQNAILTARKFSEEAFIEKITMLYRNVMKKREKCD